MATKISELPTSTTALGTEQVPIVQSATTKKTTLAQIITDLLTPTGGALKIGASDGSAGSLWTTVQGFINKILSSAGASVVGYIQAAAGAVATTADQIFSERVSVFRFMTAAQIADVKAGTLLIDVTAAIQAALTYAASLGTGCRVIAPAGKYLCSAQINISKYTTFVGDGKYTTVLSFNHTGVGLKSTSPLNSSTPVYINVRDMRLTCTNALNADGGYVDVGGSFVDVDSVAIDGFKHQIIFDQTEVSSVMRCALTAGIAGGSGLWLANGTYTGGASVGFTNSITVTANQFNAASTAAANILDDGGVNHRFRDNDWNAGLIGLRASGVAGLCVEGNESEGHGDCDIYLADTTYSSVYVGPCTGMDVSGGNVLISFSGGRNIAIQNAYGGKIVGNHFGQAANAIALLNGASNRAAGILIENNTKIITTVNRTAGPFINGFSGPLSAQIIRQGACTYVAAAQAGTGSITATPASMEFINVGTRLQVANEDGSNPELVTVTATTGSTFTATFASTKAANYTVIGVSSSVVTEGTFTPTVIGTATAGTGTYNTQFGSYSRIGNRVFFTIVLDWTAHTGAGNLAVAGLPFTALNNAANVTPVTIMANNLTMTAGNVVAGDINPNTSQIQILQTPTGGGALGLVPLDAIASLYISGSYLA